MTEEELTTAGKTSWERVTWAATVWVTQESGAERLQGEVTAGRGDTGKAPSAAADKAGAQGRHRASPAQRGRSGGRPEKQVVKTSRVQGNDRGRDASGVAH